MVLEAGLSVKDVVDDDGDGGGGDVCCWSGDWQDGATQEESSP